MANDAMIMAIDEIRFTYLRAKTMRVYAVGIAADSKGKVMVTEPPASARIRHRPKRGRPATWDFAGNGYPIYQRLGGLPDVIVAHLLIVQDRRAVREAGEIVKTVAGDDAAKKTIQAASKALAGMGGGGLAAAGAASLILPIANLVGTIIGEKKDRILQTISGSLVLDPDRREENEFSQAIKSPDNNMEIEVDVFLFDGQADEDTTADTRNAETRLEASGLLFTEEGG